MPLYTGLAEPLIRQAVDIPGRTQTFHTHGFRGSLNQILHDPRTEAIMNWLLIVDIATVAIGMILEIQFFESAVDELQESFRQCAGDARLCPDPAHMGHYGQHWMHQSAESLEWASLCILLVFLFENMLLIIANGLKLFSNIWHALDLLVVVISLVFELYGLFGGAGNKDGFSVGLVVAARSWRFIRIGHGSHGVLESEKHHDDQGSELSSHA